MMPDLVSNILRRTDGRLEHRVRQFRELELRAHYQKDEWACHCVWKRYSAKDFFALGALIYTGLRHLMPTPT